MTPTESKLPMSGTRTSIELGIAAGAGGVAAGAAAGVGAGAAAFAAGGAAADALSDFTVTTSAPVETEPPLVTCTVSTTPLTVDGTSIVALSVSSVTRGVSM